MNAAQTGSSIFAQAQGGGELPSQLIVSASTGTKSAMSRFGLVLVRRSDLFWQDGCITIWDMKQARHAALEPPWECHANRDLTGVAYNPYLTTNLSSLTLATSSCDGTIILWTCLIPPANANLEDSTFGDVALQDIPLYPVPAPVPVRIGGPELSEVSRLSEPIPSRPERITPSRSLGLFRRARRR